MFQLCIFCISVTIWGILADVILKWAAHSQDTMKAKSSPWSLVHPRLNCWRIQAACWLFHQIMGIGLRVYHWSLVYLWRTSTSGGFIKPLPWTTPVIIYFIYLIIYEDLTMNWHINLFNYSLSLNSLLQL